MLPLQIRATLMNNVANLKEPWTEKSTELFSILNTYQDFFGFGLKRDLNLPRAYALHALNHVLK